ncbi:hypothetical protein ACVI3U_003911 [Sinorhizobium medicae]|nr:hypothetical protein [Sinorhizobium medicae]
MPQLIRLATATAEAFAQPLHRDVEADLGPVAKAIDNFLAGSVMGTSIFSMR